MTAAYWEIGRRIVELDQGGTTKAEYGAEVVKRLSSDLTSRFGRGFSKRNVEQMLRFSLAWPIAQTLSAQSTGGPIPQTASEESSAATIQTPSEKSPTLSANLQIVAGEAVAHYSLEGLPNKVMTSQYKLALPEKKLLEGELERTKRAIETQASSNDK
ncbi:DUF1016 N-terminal domain-containing protein [Rhodopirellula sp. ICT_H3.1]|uniref:DUF1016 N-terminal domain-containing protein n=2 Tax=Aporhodopirellula aestuarii TaxID=2950107 RepID=A0ABT0U3A6_9BACT|nr:DUF1016 N-terminal domain-containing protein [Aporhodopirellula aestuarii]